MKLTSLFSATTILLLLITAGCSSSKNALVEKPVEATPTPTPAAQASATPLPKLPPPTKAEVDAAFHRIFGDDLIAEGGSRPFIVGDFNGDQSEDLAVIARPARGKLNDINSELSNWIIQDADRALPDMSKKVTTVHAEKRPSVENGEEVLAIIHGFGPQGWRNADARQAYLVKHAAATFVGTAPSVSVKAIRMMKLPVETEIIKEFRKNKKGFLFWTGAAYAWHPGES